MDEQTKTTVAVIAKLQGESEALKAKRDAMRFSMSDRSSEMRSLDAQIAAMEGRVRSLVAPGVAGKAGTGVLLKLQDVPGLAAEYAQLLLAVETQAAVFGMLAQQVEQAKIEETRNTPTVRILDRASIAALSLAPPEQAEHGGGFRARVRAGVRGDPGAGPPGSAGGIGRRPLAGAPAPVAALLGGLAVSGGTVGAPIAAGPGFFLDQARSTRRRSARA